MSGHAAMLVGAQWAEGHTDGPTSHDIRIKGPDAA